MLRRSGMLAALVSMLGATFDGLGNAAPIRRRRPGSYTRPLTDRERDNDARRERAGIIWRRARGSQNVLRRERLRRLAGGES